jgi:signal transduction histidine kinase
VRTVILQPAPGDTGCGIDMENLAPIFEPLYQHPNRACPSRQGLGIGLDVCEELVARHAGRRVDSQLNHGSTFLFHFRWLILDPLFPSNR